MARRPRRTVVDLESDYEEDEDEVLLDDDDYTPAPSSSRKRGSKNSLAAMTSQGGRNLESKQRRKVQNTDRQNAEDAGLDAGKKSKKRKTVSSTRTLDLFALQSRAKESTSNSRPEDVPGKAARSSNPVSDSRLWVDKYAPKTLGDLAVHSKKVAEVKEWFEGQLRGPSGSYPGSRLLVLTGPPGVGKTTTVRILADLMGVELLEWTTPAPEIWAEYTHQGACGRSYTSKLDEFESFLERGRKMSSLPLIAVTSTSDEVRPFSGDDRKRGDSKILIIDDLPYANNEATRQRLLRSLSFLAVSQEVPAILVITDESGSGGSDRLEGDSGYGRRDIIESLEKYGIKKISFNPITVNVLKKTLGKVQLLENHRLSSENLTGIAEASAGDVRQAITSLQFICLDRHLMSDFRGGFQPSFDFQSTDKTRYRDANSKLSKVAVGGRDFSLSLFHALGKLLHNKRRSDEVVEADKATGPKVRPDLQRQPLQMEEPEIILLQAHADSSTISSFLHENVLDFIDEDATADVATVATYFSDADSLLGWRGSFQSRNSFINPDEVEPSLVATAAAGSVAARGVLFGNSHPAPRRWMSVRAPALRHVERQARRKKSEKNFRNANGVLDTEMFRELMRHVDPYPCASQLNWCTPPVSQTWSLTPPDSLEREDLSMQSGFHKDDDTDLLFQPETLAPKREGFQFETTFMQMSVGDDIEDIVDPDESPPFT